MQLLRSRQAVAGGRPRVTKGGRHHLLAAPARSSASGSSNVVQPQPQQQQVVPTASAPGAGSGSSSRVVPQAAAVDMPAKERTAQEASTSDGVLGPVRSGATSEPDFVRLNNGALLPILGFGTFCQEDSNVIKMALEVGYRHLDCAAYYKNEPVVGKGIADWLASEPSKNKREDLFITSKVFNDSHRPDLVRASVEKTIKDLGVGYLDMLLIHWPDAFKPGSFSDFYGPVCSVDEDVAPPPPSADGKQGGCVTFDDEVTMEDTWQAMESCVDAGLVRCIGVSNFSHKEVKEICDMARMKPVVNQVELHPMLQQNKLVSRCFDMGVQCLAFGPLGGPNAYVPNDLLPHPSVTKVAEEVGKSNGQVLVRWSMQRGVPALVKTGSLGRLKENLFGQMDYRLTDEQMAALNALECKKRFVDVPWKTWDNSLDSEITASGTMSSAA